MKRGLVAAFLVVVADQVSKFMVFDYLNHTANVVEFSSWFNLVMAWNTGVSFSMLHNMGDKGVYVLSLFALTVVGFLIYWLKKEKIKLMQIALGFVIGGAIGNVIDRLRLGAVFDFLDVHVGAHHWPAFNVADSFICIGATLIICHGLFGEGNLSKKNVQSVEKEMKS